MLSSQPILALAMSAGLGAAGDGGECDLSWLGGHWRSGSSADFAEEIWTNPDGGMMLAVSRTVRGGAVVSFEFMRIELGETPVLIAQPSGGEGAAFEAVTCSADQIIFHNPDNGYPTHIEYARDGAALTAQIWAGDGPGTGPSWRWDPATD
jgi:hypothetical protein